MWGLPGPRIKPVSPALAGGFLTTRAPGKSLSIVLDTAEEGKGEMGVEGGCSQGKSLKEVASGK